MLATDQMQSENKSCPMSEALSDNLGSRIGIIIGSGLQLCAIADSISIRCLLREIRQY
jgi:hypothetical protein